jgi:NAD(P)-dependent dehydrogenase (short-subunit alcohol dehydrogenase family)
VKLGGQTALVIGTSALAACMCKVLVRKGCKLAVADPDAARAQALAAPLNGLALALDTDDRAMWDNAITTTIDWFGGLDLVVFATQTLRAVDNQTTDPASHELISSLYKTRGLLAPFLGMEAVNARLPHPKTPTTVHFLNACAWQAEATSPMQSAHQHGLRAWLEAGQKTTGPGHRPSLIVGCGIPPSKPTPPADEIAAATVWALERGACQTFVPGGWGVRAFLRQN